MPENFVTEPKDKDIGSLVTDPIVNKWSKFADPVTGLIDRNSKGLIDQLDSDSRLLQVQAACNPGDKELVAKAAFHAACHRQKLRTMLRQQGASNSVMAAFSKVSLYLSADSSKHKMKKYIFRRKDAGECQ